MDAMVEAHEREDSLVLEAHVVVKPLVELGVLERGVVQPGAGRLVDRLLGLRMRDQRDPVVGLVVGQPGGAVALVPGHHFVELEGEEGGVVQFRRDDGASLATVRHHFSLQEEGFRT